jgi:hypothetical protein
LQFRYARVPSIDIGLVLDSTKEPLVGRPGLDLSELIAAAARLVLMNESCRHPKAIGSDSGRI